LLRAYPRELAEAQARPAEMFDHALQSLELFRLAEYRAGQAMALQDVGHAHALLGNHEQAITYCESALTAMREIGERRWEGAVWDSLGDVHHSAGDLPSARRAWASALQIFDEIDHPDGDRVRGKLRSDDRQAAPAGLPAGA
jgi:tetratricopeptide (TPR) repeat protein